MCKQPKKTHEVLLNIFQCRKNINFEKRKKMFLKKHFFEKKHFYEKLMKCFLLATLDVARIY